MIKFVQLPLSLILVTVCPSLPAQDAAIANAKLEHALHLADRYNWDDARVDFAAAEQLFQAAGDERNALYAKLGRIRSTADDESCRRQRLGSQPNLKESPYSNRIYNFAFSALL